jgi:hypothetical protein
VIIIYDVDCITILYLGGGVKDIYESQMVFECVVNVVLNDRPAASQLSNFLEFYILFLALYTGINILYL